MGLISIKVWLVLHCCGGRGVVRLEMSALPVSSQVACQSGAGVCLSGESRPAQSRKGGPEGCLTTTPDRDNIL